MRTEYFFTFFLRTVFSSISEKITSGQCLISSTKGKAEKGFPEAGQKKITVPAYP